MAQTFRVNLFFRSGEYGWTETYFAVSNAIDDFLTNNAIAALCGVRRPLSPPTVEITQARVSQEGIFRDSYIFVSPQGPGKGTFAKDNENDPFQSLLCRVEGGDRTRRQLYLRGVPDSIFGGDDDQEYFPSPAFRNSFRAFRNLLASGAWQIRTSASRVNSQLSFAPPTIASPQALPTVTVRMPGNVPAGMVPGALVKLGGARGCSGFNGLWIVGDIQLGVGSPPLNQFTTEPRRNPVYGTPYNLVSFAVVTPGATPITDVFGLKGDKRSTGGPTVRPRGRSRPARV